MVRTDVWIADAPGAFWEGAPSRPQTSCCSIAGLAADVLPVQLSDCWPAGLMSGQLSYDRSERVGEVGAEDKVGEADLFPSPLDLLGGRRGVIR